MEIKNPLLAVKNMEKGKSFYRRVLGLHVIADQGHQRIDGIVQKRHCPAAIRAVVWKKA